MKITVKNTGDTGFFIEETDLNYTVHPTEDWLSSTVHEGTLAPGDGDTFDVWVDRSGLDIGINSGWVDVSSNGGDGHVKVLVWRNDTPAATPAP